MAAKKSPSTKTEFSYQIKLKRQLFDSLAAMLRAKIDIIAALDSLGRERRSTYEANLIKNMKIDLNDGLPIWQVLAKYEMIPLQLQALVRIGEESGTLPQNIHAVQKQMTKNKQFTSRLRSASLYPAFVLMLLFVVSLVVVTFVLPRLSDVYRSLKADLPWFTRVMINAGDFMTEYGLIVVPWVLITVVLSTYFVFFHRKTKHIGEKIMFNVPLIGKIIVELQISRFGQMMYNLTLGGIPINKALELLIDTTDHHIYKKFYTSLLKSLEEGNTFGYSFQTIPKSTKIMPLVAQQVVVSGEQTGDLNGAFKQLGDEFERRTETSAKDFSTIFEPVLIVGVWIGVALVAFAVILPLYSVVGSFENLTTPGGLTGGAGTPPPQVIDFDANDFVEADSINDILDAEEEAQQSAPDETPAETEEEENDTGFSPGQDIDFSR